MEDRFTHGPEENAGTDPAFERHREPLPHGVFRFCVFAADDNVADFGKGQTEDNKNQQKAEKDKPPAPVESHPVKTDVEHLTELLLIENTSNDDGYGDKIAREENRLGKFYFFSGERHDEIPKNK